MRYNESDKGSSYVKNYYVASSRAANYVYKYVSNIVMKERTIYTHIQQPCDRSDCAASIISPVTGRYASVKVNIYAYTGNNARQSCNYITSTLLLPRISANNEEASLRELRSRSIIPKRFTLEGEDPLGCNSSRNSVISYILLSCYRTSCTQHVPELSHFLSAADSLINSKLTFPRRELGRETQLRGEKFRRKSITERYRLARIASTSPSTLDNSREDRKVEGLARLSQREGRISAKNRSSFGFAGEPTTNGKCNSFGIFCIYTYIRRTR